MERALDDYAAGGDPFEQAKATRRQLKRAEDRLLALLAGHPSPERVSPP